MSGKKAKEQRARDEVEWARREVLEVRYLNDRLAEERDGLLEEVETLQALVKQAMTAAAAQDLSAAPSHSAEAAWLCRLSRVVLELDESCDEDGDTGEAMLPMDGWERLVNLSRAVSAGLHPDKQEMEP